MSNSYFSFKQFTVWQDKTAMKVTTDACIQGAYTPVSPCAATVLDLGCGTGLLALMMAQKAPAITVDCIDIDAGACAQCAENAEKSPWGDRINVLNGDARVTLSGRRYDMIICNPPFFNKSLLGPVKEKNLARHTLTLINTDIIAIMNNVITEEGCISILLPTTEYALWKQAAASAGWYVAQELSVHDRTGKPATRTIGIYTRTQSPTIQDVLIIKDGDNYTPKFRALLSPYYLHL